MYLARAEKTVKIFKNTRNGEKGEYIYKDYMNTNDVGMFAIYCFGHILFWPNTFALDKT